MPSHNKKIALACLLLLTACERHWQKYGASEAEFNQDMARCRMSLAGSPMPYQKQNTSTGDVPGAMQDLGASISNSANRGMYIGDCMMAQGWQLKD